VCVAPLWVRSSPKRHDTQAQVRGISTLFSKERRERETKESRYVLYAGGGRETRTGSSILQAALRANASLVESEACIGEGQSLVTARHIGGRLVSRRRLAMLK
jgi:hypothetical protein